MPRSGRLAQGLLQLAGTVGQGAGANGGRAALDGMQGRGAAWTSPSPSWRSSWAKRSCISGTKRRNTWTISSRLPPKRPTISPRASTSSPASAVVAGAPCRRSCRDDRADKAPGAPCRSASPHGRSCPPPGGFAVGQRGVGGHGQDRQPGEAPVGADSPGRLETIDIRHLHVHQHRVERHARLQHLLNARQPTVGEGRAPSLLNSSAATGGSARCPPPADARPATAGCAPPGAAGWPGRPVHRAGHAAPSRPVAWA